MKKFFIVLLIIILGLSLLANVPESETLNELTEVQDIYNLLESYTLMMNHHYDEAIKKLEENQKSIPKNSPEYDKMCSIYSISYYHKSFDFGFENQWVDALKYAEMSYSWYNKIKDKEIFDESYFYEIVNRIILSYHKTGQFNKAGKYKKILKKAYKKDLLPESLEFGCLIDQFDYEDKKVLAYENYPELGDKETEGSFTKVLYLIYEKDLEKDEYVNAFRIHILKFHKFGDRSIKFDYIMHLRVRNIDSMQMYFYKKKLDYAAIHNDVLKVINSYYHPEKEETDEQLGSEVNEEMKDNE